MKKWMSLPHYPQTGGAAGRAPSPSPEPPAPAPVPVARRRPWRSHVLVPHAFGRLAALSPSLAMSPKPDRPPPDGGWGWVIVFASFMIHIVTDGVTYDFGLVLPKIQKEFGSSHAATAWVQSTLAGVTLCSGPISSAFVNKYGCRPVTIVGAVLGGVCLAASAYADSVWLLYLTIGLGTGMGFGLIYLPAIVSVTCYFEKYRSLATGIAVCGSGLGTMVFAPLTTWLLQVLGWRNTLTVMGVLVLKCVIYGILFRPVESIKSKAVPMDEYQPVTAKESSVNIVVNGHDPDEQRRPHSVHTFSAIKHANGLAPVTKEDDEVVRSALSQPMLMCQTVVDASGRTRLQSESGSVRSNQSGIMYRKDVLYSGSMQNLHHARKSIQMQEDKTFMDEGWAGKKKVEKVVVCGCFLCFPETRDTLQEMLDFSLLKDPIFLLFTLSNFCTSIGFYIPYTFIAPMSKEKAGLSENEQGHVIAVIGIANTFGRIVLGYLSDKTWVNRLWVYNVSLAVCGISTILSAFCYDFVTFCIYASMFGFTIGAYVGLTSVILVDLLGLNKLTNAFGLLLLFQGIASFLGGPIAGMLKDSTSSYDPGFYVAGGTLAASGIMLFIVPMLQRRVNRKPKHANCAS